MTTATASAGPAAAPSPLSFRDVLRIDVMRRVWFAQVISLFGDFLALFAVIAIVTFRMQGTAAQVTGLQIAFMGSRIIGPAAAGAIVATFTPNVCYLLDVLSFVLSAALIGSVVITRPPTMQAAAASSSYRIHQIWADMKQGMTFILHHAA